MFRRAVENRQCHGLILDLAAGQYSVRSPAAVLAPEERLTNSSAWSARLERACLILWSGEDAKHCTQSLELSRRVVAEHSGEPAVGSEESAIEAKKAQAYGSAVGQASKQSFGATQRVFHTATSRHGFLEIPDLLAQASDLVDQLLLGAVLVAHGKM
jgi:hypothetical protein